MRRPSWSRIVRAAAILALGALAIHQLSYLLAHGDEAGRALALHGHGYLTTLGPALAAAAVALLAATLASAALPPHAGRSRRETCFELRAVALALAVFAIFFVQELAEGLLSPGHPDALAAFLETGWIGLPLAFPIGALAALALGGLECVERLIAAASVARKRQAEGVDRPLSGSRDEHGTAIALLGLGGGLSRRGPPAPAAL
jgi:plasmid stabilization system protein ParE